jgi:hypothetical protein
MNTVERIVLCYFQTVHRCLVASDVKVPGGNNRQFDLLAYSLCDRAQYHVETSVTHHLNWCPTLAQVEEIFRRKFFGVPRKKDGKNTDFERGRNYLGQIKAAYAEYGFEYDQVTRVLCFWKVRDATPEAVVAHMRGVARGYGLPDPKCELLSLRDNVLPKLTESVEKSNYEDDVLRMISLLKEQRRQGQQEGRRREQPSAPPPARPSAPPPS